MAEKTDNDDPIVTIKMPKDDFPMTDELRRTLNQERLRAEDNQLGTMKDDDEIIVSDDDKDCLFEDASDSITEGGGPDDFSRPSEWRPKPEDKETEEEEAIAPGDDVVKDTLGHEESSPDFINEDLLKCWEVGDTVLSHTELEQKRLEAIQYKLEGNALYTDSKLREACDKYTAGLRVCPLKFPQDRAVLFANRGQMKRKMGLTDLAIKNCTKAIELNPTYLKALLRRAEIYEETEKLDEALKDYQSVLEHDPRNVAAHRAVRELPAKIEERNEKLKAEMMDNLKKLGNMCLKPFGLSTNNFKMEQNENGSYNIQFQQNQWNSN